jgi:hypothetical protein
MIIDLGDLVFITPNPQHTIMYFIIHPFYVWDITVHTFEKIRFFTIP